MAARKSDSLRPGDTYEVRTGEFKGQTATIIDPTVMPKGHPAQRKIIVEVGGERVYMLPRFLETGPVAPPVPPLPVEAVDTEPEAPAPVLPEPAAAPAHKPLASVGSPITSLDDPRLDPYRPDPSVVKQYISRKVPGGARDTDFLLKFWRDRQNLMLVGDTQAGKTMLVNVLAVLAGKEMGLSKPLPVFTLSGSSGVTDFDLFGQPAAYMDPATGVERIVYLSGVVDLAARVGGFLYMDEVNMMGERVTSSLHPLCDYRRAFVNRNKPVDSNGLFVPEQVTAHDDLWIIGTINPAYKGAGQLQEAFANRFVFIPWGYDDATEKKLIPLASVRLFGTALREARKARSITTPVGTAALSRLCEHVKDHSVETGLWMFLSMFSPAEQPRVQAIVEDRSIASLISDELAAHAKAESGEEDPAAEDTDPVYGLAASLAAQANQP